MRVAAFSACVLGMSAASSLGQVLNGDFASGNFGFSSELDYAAFNSGEGQYTVTTTPSGFNPGFADPAGATPMLVVNGFMSPTAGASIAWSGHAGVSSGYCYGFNARVTLAAESPDGIPTRVRLVDGRSNPIGGYVELPATPGEWVTVYGETWVLFGRSSITVGLEYDGAGPNDFYIDHVVRTGPTCVLDCFGSTMDFNGDGDIGTDQDIEAFFACLAGSCCATCNPNGADFNMDGDVGTDQDIEDFFRVLATGEC
jgi:hypothetical protein